MTAAETQLFREMHSEEIDPKAAPGRSSPEGFGSRDAAILGDLKANAGRGAGNSMLLMVMKKGA
jgi:hypothetical protein